MRKRKGWKWKWEIELKKAGTSHQGYSPNKIGHAINPIAFDFDCLDSFNKGALGVACCR